MGPVHFDHRLYQPGARQDAEATPGVLTAIAPGQVDEKMVEEANAKRALRAANPSPPPEIPAAAETEFTPPRDLRLRRRQMGAASRTNRPGGPGVRRDGSQVPQGGRSVMATEDDLIPLDTLTDALVGPPTRT